MIGESKLNSKFLKWTGIWAIWTLFALLLTSQVALQYRMTENPVSFWRILSWQLFSGYLWFALTPLILWFGRKFPFEEGKWKVTVPFHLVASVLVAFFQLAVDAAVLPKLGYLKRYESAPFIEIYKIFLLINLHFSVGIYWVVLMISQAVNYYRKYRERELRTSQLETQLATTRLQVLKTQLHPHFLFNTLNAISELIHKDPEAAERMIGDLSDLLRMSFEKLEVQEISLKQELEFLKKYLEIEQMRFHDRLRVEMNIAPETLDAKVPNMILQPLVENAIKHGLAPRSEGGHQPGSGASQAGRMRPPSAAARSGRRAMRPSRAAAQSGSGTASSSRKATHPPADPSRPRFRARDRPGLPLRSSRAPASAARRAMAAASAGGEALSTTSTSKSRRDCAASPPRQARR